MSRWEHEAVLEAMQSAAGSTRPRCMRIRRQTVEHPFGTIKSWMGSDAFPDQDPGSGQYRDEPARARLQLEARDEIARAGCIDECDEGLRLFALAQRKMQPSHWHFKPRANPASRRVDQDGAFLPLSRTSASENKTFPVHRCFYTVWATTCRSYPGSKCPDNSHSDRSN